jgi:hypothetical protein
VVVGEAVELGGHDEVVLVQALDLLGPQRDRRVAPAEADVGVVPLRLGQFAARATKANAPRKSLNRKRRSIRVASSTSAQSGACAR